MGLSNPSYFINHIIKNKKNMKNSIIVPFDLNTARKTHGFTSPAAATTASTIGE